MDDDTRDMARRTDNLETDPAKHRLFRLIYTLDDFLHFQPLPDRARAAIDSTLMELLEEVRMLPPLRPLD